MKNIKYKSLFVFLFFITQQVISQTVEEKIKICINQHNEYKVNIDTLRLTKDSHVFYEKSILQECFIQENIMNGATCVEYFKSPKMKILCDIYVLFTGQNENRIFSLIDEQQNKIFDLKKYNCSDMNKNIGAFEIINDIKLKEVEDSYKKWIDLFERKGYNYLKEKNINPLSFCTFKWIEEIGVIKNGDFKVDLIEMTKLLISNEEYLSYFVKVNGLDRFYISLSNKDKICNIAILTFINNMRPFTQNILNFSIKYNANNINEITIIDKLDKLDYNKKVKFLYDLIKNKEINVVLN